MKKNVFAACLLVCILALAGCSAAETHEPPAECVSVSEIDLSGVRAIRIDSGTTGEKVLLTGPDDIAALISAVAPLSGSDPVSSRGYYGWTYGFEFFETQSPEENDDPIWSFALFDANADTTYLICGVYEFINGVQYGAMYSVDPETADAVESLCASFYR